MHYICIITVIYIMYTNVSMLIYVIEPKRKKKHGERGKIVRLPKKTWREEDTRRSAYLRASRRSCCSECEQEQHQGDPNFLYT